ncbi:exocyst complex component EXO70C1 [Euphorbia lathyris]|uniref:exocyst complex component EXO70C1 n=1 Tax=Euphorbia lathyris TaxID=212925 RepID=UPI0033142EFE
MDKISGEENVGLGKLESTEAKSNGGDSDNSDEIPESIVPQLLEDVDKFLETLPEKTQPPQLPDCVDSLVKVTEKMMAEFSQFKNIHEESESERRVLIFGCLTRISKLINRLNEFNPNPSVAGILNRATTVLHLAMSLLDNEFRTMLDTCFAFYSRTPRAEPESESDNKADEDFPFYTEDTLEKLSKIATAMITLGYEKECSMTYNMIRRNAFNMELDNLGFNKISIEDVQKMHWESLEAEIICWIQLLKHCSSVLLPKEHSLCDSVFHRFPSVGKALFSDLASAIIARFLNFAEAVTLTRRSAEKLFKFLDMYETLRDIIPAVVETLATGIKPEVYTAKTRLGEAAVSIFSDLENSIRSDNGKIPVPSGAVHPLTRYTMNYLKYACEYAVTLEEVFSLQRQRKEKNTATGEPEKLDGEIPTGANEDGTPKTSPFSMQLNTIMDLLDDNLEIKSKLYRDTSLGYVFLMNNGRYILQKIKGSEEINDIMGATWCRKRSSDLRMYHKGYTRETWSRLLNCMSLDGLQNQGKVAKPMLKERFKMFNNVIDEIHRTQSTWVVSDEQLQSELRVSVGALVIPAYRSFLGRFQQCFSSGRQTEKYVKYQPEDIENLIEELFDGNPNSASRKRP